jgi:hypothetical protein
MWYGKYRASLLDGLLVSFIISSHIILISLIYFRYFSMRIPYLLK